MNPALPHIDIERWVQCEREALGGPDRRGAPPGGSHVASLVSQRVRRILAGEVAAGEELDFGDVTTDSTTPRTADIGRICALMAAEARAVIRSAGLTDGVHVVDTVTARRITGQWYRLGQRLLEPEHLDAPAAWIVHVPRVRLDQEVRATLHGRDADSLRDDYSAMALRVEDILTRGAVALPRPGDHCRACALDCAVRAA